MTDALGNRIGRGGIAMLGHCFVLVLGLVTGVAHPAQALDLTFPGATKQTATRIENNASIRLPTGPFADGVLPTRLAEGALDMAAFQVSLPRPSTLDLMQGLRAQLAAAGYDVVFECETAVCGGFDFRFGTEVLPEPDMHVDLGDFRYLLAEGSGDRSVALLVSRSAQIGFVQVTQVGAQTPVVARPTVAPMPGVAEKLEPQTSASPTKPDSSGQGFAAGLDNGLSQVLEDLVFPSGSSTLAEADYASLAALAAWMAADDARRVVLVGHTDASGALEGNIRLSLLRAESVRQRLINDYGITPNRIVAEGVGFLSPRDSNLTEAGRRNNRRVEVMATSTLDMQP